MREELGKIFVMEARAEISPREWPVKAASCWTKLFEHKLRKTL
jgi:hypothetical protein